ncbi:type I-E CRISPR-associated protein Cse1/CasA [Longibacter salinarum]|nr:type I-E CRISPR-associated protein Cse1/CasA [Longibacter salinarum]
MEAEENKFSLLDDGLFRVRGDDGVRECSLPEVLAALQADAVASFDGLQAHQEQAWYAFLVQLAAMIRARTDRTGDLDTSDWRSGCLDLAEGNENAWHLVVSDVTEPAFMQSPVPEGSLDEAKYKSDIPSPSSLDVLVTSKNHDVKQTPIRYPRTEHWIYALITLQTMEGFLGRGNYGIARMNGGFGNRPLVGLAPGLSFGERFRRDVRVLAETHDDTVLWDADGRFKLLWTEPWDGAKASAISLDNCDPYVIEICRRIRFTMDDGSLTCWRANTKGQRLNVPSSLSGQTEDPWTPVDKGEDKALTLGGGGFTYRKLTDILSGNYERPVTLERQSNDAGAMFVTARSLVRGQGKTEGLHHRDIFVPGEASGFFSQGSDLWQKLAEISEQRVEMVQEVESRVLRPAVAALLTGGRRDEQPDWDVVQPWIDAFDTRVNEVFFEKLWAAVNLDKRQAQNAWEHFLKTEACSQFEAATENVPIPDLRKWRALSAARSIFESRIRDTLEMAYDDESSSTDTDE